jgi:hypothetical protein
MVKLKEIVHLCKESGSGVNPSGLALFIKPKQSNEKKIK